MIIKPDDYSDARHVRNPHGAVILDGQTVADTQQCVHCGGHFVVRRGSGKIRGWCQRCGGPTCGPQCMTCVPFEKWLKQVESAG